MFKDLAALSLITNSPAAEKGRAAYHAGHGSDANPFSAQTGLAAEWLFGWKDAHRATAANTDDEGTAKAV